VLELYVEPKLNAKRSLRTVQTLIQPQRTIVGGFASDAVRAGTTLWFVMRSLVVVFPKTPTEKRATCCNGNAFKHVEKSP
jgi:hypothetical protein